ncbi:MAG: ABC transporter permease [bacterium]|nr:ABC transporter permease [bacterium]
MMSAIAAVVHRESRIRVTNATFIFWDLLSPLAYLLVFGVGIDAALGPPAAMGGVDYNAFFLGGVLGMASFTIASNTAWSFFMDRDNGIFYEMLTYPLSRSQYLLGKVLFNVGVALLQAAIAVGLGAVLLGIPIVWRYLPLLVVAVAVGTAGWFFFYAIFALRIRRNDAFNTVTSIFYFVFLFASSMFYPLEPLPAWFQAVALANPITWHVDVLRFATIGIGAPAALWWQGAAFTAFAVACFAAATRILDRQE